VIKYIRTNFYNEDFIGLVKRLDADLAERDGEEHAFYSQYNKIDLLQHVIVAYHADVPSGCGAIKKLGPEVMEVKRMYTLPEKRGLGIASGILKRLENWSIELNCFQCRLETGKKQPEAISLYTKSGYIFIPNYGQYAGISNSICFEKTLTRATNFHS
jgi:GNAT superfamily N-acetyltransferase